MDEVKCAGCGTNRPAEIASMQVRPACPKCGEKGLNISVSFEDAASLEVTDSISSALFPAQQDRDWNIRWMLINNEIKEILSPIFEPMSATLIHAAHQKLCSFFIQAYHLKDALKGAAPGLRLRPEDVEEAINNDPRLALLADLANLDKHFKLSRPPRSGHTPVFEQIHGVDSESGNGWRLVASIKHGSLLLDGIAVAQDVIAAWNEKMRSWNLI